MRNINERMVWGLVGLAAAGGFFLGMVTVIYIYNSGAGAYGH